MDPLSLRSTSTHARLCSTGHWRATPSGSATCCAGKQTFATTATLSSPISSTNQVRNTRLPRACSVVLSACHVRFHTCGCAWQCVCWRARAQLNECSILFCMTMWQSALVNSYQSLRAQRTFSLFLVSLHGPLDLQMTRQLTYVFQSEME